MMRKFCLMFILLATVQMINAQEEIALPTEPSNGFAFSLGCKVTIKLVPTDSINFDYSVLSIESYQEPIYLKKTEDLFDKEGPPNTLTLYFTYGYFGEKMTEKDMRIFLVIKNYTDNILQYSSDIQRMEDGEFEETSNAGIYSKAIATEIWPYMIHNIGLWGFKKRVLAQEVEEIKKGTKKIEE